MSLTLRIPRAYGKPGIFVFGTVVAHPPPGQTFDGKLLRISFIGEHVLHTPCQDASGVDKEHSTTFLDIRRNVYEGREREFDLELAEGEESNVMFRLPEVPGTSGADGVLQNIARCPTLPYPIALPPSGDITPRNTIPYRLEAALEDDNFGYRVWTSVPISFSLTRDEEVPDPGFVSIVQEKTTCGDDQRGEVTSVKVTLDGLKVIVQDIPSPLILRLNLSTELGQSDATAILKSCRLQLVEHTIAYLEGFQDHCESREHMVISRSLSGESNATKEFPMDLAALLGSAALFTNFLPSFNCASIQRSYDLRVTIVLKINGASSEFDLTIRSMEVQASELASDAKAKEENSKKRPARVPNIPPNFPFKIMRPQTKTSNAT